MQTQKRLCLTVSSSEYEHVQDMDMANISGSNDSNSDGMVQVIQNNFWVSGVLYMCPIAPKAFQRQLINILEMNS
jgi:hypothetical protein